MKRKSHFEKRLLWGEESLTLKETSTKRKSFWGKNQGISGDYQNKKTKKKPKKNKNPKNSKSPKKQKKQKNQRHQSRQSGCTYCFFPQIAGSYRGSYFSKVGLLITEIAAAPYLPSSFVSLHLSPCILITEIAAAPSLPSSFVSLHLSPCILITEIAAAPSLPSSFVSLHADYRNRCRS